MLQAPKLASNFGFQCIAELRFVEPSGYCGHLLVRIINGKEQSVLANLLDCLKKRLGVIVAACRQPDMVCKIETRSFASLRAFRTFELLVESVLQMGQDVG